MATDDDAIATQEIADDLRKNQIRVIRGGTALWRVILEDLEKAEAALVASLAAVDPAAPQTQLGKQNRTTRTLTEVRRVIRRIYRDMRDKEQRYTRREARVEADFMNRAFKSGLAEVGVVYRNVRLTDEFLDSLADQTLVEGLPSDRWWASQSQDVLEEFESQMRQGLIQGETTAQLTTRVTGGTINGRPVTGIMDVSRSHAEALVRTKVAGVANNARVAVVERNADIVESYIHLSTLDSRTTQICLARDGKQWDQETKEPIGHDLPWNPPPVHWNCRSVLVPKVEGADAFVGTRPAVEISERELVIEYAQANNLDPRIRTRDALPYGTKGDFDEFARQRRREATRIVGASESGEEFIRRMGVEFQNSTFGVARARAFREGRITLRDMLNASGDAELTDAELGLAA